MKICPVGGHYFISFAVKICPFEGHYSMAMDIIKYHNSMKNCPHGHFFTGHYYVLQMLRRDYQINFFNRCCP